MNSGLIDRAAAFTRDAISPRAQAWERDRTMPVETFRAAAAKGFCGMMVPRDQGGLGIPLSAAMGVFEEIATACMAFAFSLEVQNNTARSVAINGTPDQVARYLPGLLSGDIVAAFLLTGPGAGSDAAAITTTATRDSDGWVIDGEKAWITNASTASLLCVFAQTDSSQGSRGIATFLVEADNPGVERLPAYELMGGHAMGTGGFRFTDCRVSGDALFRGPGVGFKEAMRGIDVARTGVSALCCGMMRAGLDIALQYATRRRAFGQATIEFQGLQWMLADVATDLEAARLLTRAAAQAIDHGHGTVAASHAKKFATRAAVKGLADCMQVMGAAGFKSDQPLGRHLACAKMAHYLDGTTEIQNLIIARDLVRDVN
ncbi:MAG: acyl-CoA dehydrogenase family protein [Pseudomonadota bacterium]|nr:acyl-CoA dehydrogenase family protein [Pseudomonadota bacterium]